MSTTALAKALSRLPALDLELFEAGLANPQLIGDESTSDALLMKHGIFSKLGAEGVFTFVTREGFAGAIKFADGSLRTALRVSAALLHKHELITDAQKQAIEAEDALQVLGGGRVIGEINICI
jgi:L-asparaginase II